MMPMIKVFSVDNPVFQYRFIHLTSSTVDGGKYLTDCTLYVTVEPCTMCAGAIGWAQIPRIVYGAPDEKRGYHDIAPHAMHPKATVVSGILEDECRELMQTFFKAKR